MTARAGSIRGSAGHLLEPPRHESTNAPAERTADTKRRLVDSLYRKYSEALSAFLSRQRVQPHELADIVQETYCRIQQVCDVGRIRNPRAFLFRVATNIRFNERERLRSRIDRNRLDIETVEVPSEEPSAYRRFKGEQDLEIVLAAFEELSRPCREAFVMSRFESLTFPQIAARLGVSVSMVEKHIAQAVSHMRHSLESHRPQAREKMRRMAK